MMSFEVCASRPVRYLRIVHDLFQCSMHGTISVAALKIEADSMVQNCCSLIECVSSIERRLKLFL